MGSKLWCAGSLRACLGCSGMLTFNSGKAAAAHIWRLNGTRERKTKGNIKSMGTVSNFPSFYASFLLFD